MKTKILALLNSIKRNGIKFTLEKVFENIFGNSFIDLQKKNRFLEQKNLILSLDISPKDLEKNFQLINDPENKAAKIETINWLLPSFEHVLYGGIYTILRFASYFQEKGIHNRIIIYNNSYFDVENMKNHVADYFPALSDAKFVAFDGKLKHMPESDAVISTFWTSAYLNVKILNTKKKFYFIQDYEPLFYSASSYYALAEASYRFGFKGLVNTPGLADFVRQQHGIECKKFYPCVDERIYNISDQQIKSKLRKKVIDIFVYGRPNHDRNAFELAIVALARLKEKYGDKITIYSAGDNWKEEDFGVKGMIQNLGRLDSLEKVADLYRKSDIGLVFMFTKHPSYQPFEYMACGCAVITNYNNANLWYLKDGENALLSEPTPSCIVKKVSELIEDAELRKKLVENGILEIKKHAWEEECQKIYNYVIKK